MSLEKKLNQLYKLLENIINLIKVNSVFFLFFYFGKNQLKTNEILF